jgi:hypothetical protein
MKKTNNKIFVLNHYLSLVLIGVHRCSSVANHSLFLVFS